jgi:hypothetical protein
VRPDNADATAFSTPTDNGMRTLNPTCVGAEKTRILDARSRHRRCEESLRVSARSARSARSGEFWVN